MIRYGSGRHFIYAILSPTAGQIKFGCSANPGERLEELQWAHGHRLELLAQVEGWKHEERKIHERLRRHQLCGEWFDDAPDVLAVVEEMKAKQRSRAA